MPFPLLLVSVRNREEAAIAAAAGSDLVDAKNPTHGALGALPPAVVRDIVATVGSRARTSAVAGESKDETRLLPDITAIAATDVDYVKVALHPEFDDGVLARAAAAAGGRLIGVCFAEDGLASVSVPRLAAAGFAGAMVDTCGKDGRGLTTLATTDELEAFTAACRAHGLLCGLAGSLTIADIPRLGGIGPDYFGFRGGLCRNGDRRNPLDPQRVAQAVRELRASSRFVAA